MWVDYWCTDRLCCFANRRTYMKSRFSRYCNDVWTETRSFTVFFIYFRVLY